MRAVIGDWDGLSAEAQRKLSVNGITQRAYDYYDMVGASAKAPSSWQRLQTEMRESPGLWLVLLASIVLTVATVLVPVAWKIQTFGAASWCAGYVYGRAS